MSPVFLSWVAMNKYKAVWVTGTIDIGDYEIHALVLPELLKDQDNDKMVLKKVIFSEFIY